MWCTTSVWSIICVGNANVLGNISPTAPRTPKDLSVPMFAREGMADGLKVGPCQVKATRVPEGRIAMDDHWGGKTQG